MHSCNLVSAKNPKEHSETQSALIVSRYVFKQIKHPKELQEMQSVLYFKLHFSQM